MALVEQLQRVRYVQTDAAYNALCDSRDDWLIALGGDSHGARIARAMQGLLGRGRFMNGLRLNNQFNFCKGGWS